MGMDHSSTRSGSREGALRRHRPRLRRPAARARVRARRVRGRRHRRRRAQGRRDQRPARSYIVDTKRRRDPRAGRAREVPRDDRLLRPSATSTRSTSASDAAAEDEGPGPDLHRLGGERDQAVPPQGPARHPREHDLPGHDRGGRAAGARAGGLEVGQDFCLAFSPERIDPGNKHLQHAQHPEGRRRRTRRSCTEVAKALYEQTSRRSSRCRRPQRRRDGEAPREHVPERQHRPGERDRADVRRARHQRLGGDRRREDEALRLHAVLPGPGPRRALHPDRSVLSRRGRRR